MEGNDLKRFENFKPEEYQELVSDPIKLAGIWESCDQGKQLFEQQKDQAESNLATARAIEKRVVENGELREKLENSIKELDSKHQEWQRAEAEMHSALEPMSRQGIKQRLERLYNESEDICQALEGSWSKSDDLQTFVNELQQQHVLKHTRKLKLESL